MDRILWEMSGPEPKPQLQHSFCGKIGSLSTFFETNFWNPAAL